MILPGYNLIAEVPTITKNPAKSIMNFQRPAQRLCGTLT
jgi:hypothetical protein